MAKVAVFRQEAGEDRFSPEQARDILLGLTETDMRIIDALDASRSRQSIDDIELGAQALVPPGETQQSLEHLGQFGLLAFNKDDQRTGLDYIALEEVIAKS